VTPQRFIAACHFCGRDLDIRANGVHQFASGWVKNRSGGGGHGLSLPKRENHWSHGLCIERRVRGTFDQRGLFGEQQSAEPPPTNASYDVSGNLLHVCNVCGADAPFGIGVSLRRGELGLWYCDKHRPMPWDT
jgi:hypothetical protein